MSASKLAPSWLKEPVDLSATPSAIWPASMVRHESGELVVGGVQISQLVAQYGTPLMVVDKGEFFARAKRVSEAFASSTASVGTSAKVYYAGKALLTTEIVRWVSELGLNLDVATGGELAIALRGGIDPQRIGLHGNNKSLWEIGRAVTAGVGAIVIDSEIEIERIASVAASQGKTQRVRLRVNSGVHAHTHEYLATAREDQKFGVPLNEVEGLVAKIRSHSSLSFIGLHSHIGSQIFTPEGFVESVKRLIPLHKKLLEGGSVPQLNLGGGFGVNYTQADSASEIEVFADAIANAVREECQSAGIELPELCFEPGRFIAGPAGITVYNVGTTKDVLVSTDSGEGVRRYVSIDGGMGDNIRPALYEADYSAVLASRVSDADAALSRVVGKHCESGDIVVRDSYLPSDVGPNDLLAVATTGAYCHSLASNYNYLPRPGIVAVSEGTSQLILRPETEADMFARDPGFEQG